MVDFLLGFIGFYWWKRREVVVLWSGQCHERCRNSWCLWKPCWITKIVWNTIVRWCDQLDWFTVEDGKTGKHDIFFKRVFWFFLKIHSLSQDLRETLGKTMVALNILGKWPLRLRCGIKHGKNVMLSVLKFVLFLRNSIQLKYNHPQ